MVQNQMELALRATVRHYHGQNSSPPNQKNGTNQARPKWKNRLQDHVQKTAETHHRNSRSTFFSKSSQLDSLHLLRTIPLSRAWLAKYNLTSRLRREVSSFIARSSAMVPEILLIACVDGTGVPDLMANFTQKICVLNVA
jgi:hypothetical protein